MRGENGSSRRRSYEDADVLIATDFEGGNGHDIRRLGAGHYALRLEPEPGGHRFAGIDYYVCFGVRNLRREPPTVRVRLETRLHSHEHWHDSRHLIVRCGDLGRDDAPVLLMSQTTQAPEALGSHACRALIEFLLAGGPLAADGDDGTPTTAPAP